MTHRKQQKRLLKIGLDVDLTRTVVYFYYIGLSYIRYCEYGN